MVRVSATYDSELKSKVFMIRGDERYTRSTNTTLNIQKYTTYDSKGYDLPITVNVQRDVGESKVVIYDNDEPIMVIDWTEDTSSKTFTSKLTWDTEHIIHAEYKGNSSCSNSQSSKESVRYDNPDIYNTSITRVDNILQSEKNTEISFQFNVNAEGGSVNNLTVNLYEGVNIIGTGNTTNGLVTIKHKFDSNGLKTLRAVYEGNSNQFASELEFNVCIGYDIVFSEYPSVLLNQTSQTYKATIYDFNNNPVSNKSLSLYYMDGSNTAKKLATSTSNEGGIATFTQAINWAMQNITSPVKFYITDNNTVTSNVEIPFAQVRSITLNDAETGYGISTPITGKVSLTESVSVPVTIVAEATNTTYDLSYNSLFTVTIQTDSQGNFSYNYDGQGAGITNISATATGVTATATLKDYIQLWRIGNPINTNYESTNLLLTQLTKGYFISRQNNTNTANLTFNDTLLNERLIYERECKFTLVDDPTGSIGITGLNVPLPLNAKKGDTIVIQFLFDKLKWFIEGNEQHYEISNDLYLNNLDKRTMRFVVNSNDGSLTFNNLRYYILKGDE